MAPDSDYLTSVNGLDISLYDPLGVSIVEVLRSTDLVRTTAGDLMPAEVVSVWWTEGTAAVNGAQSAGEAAATIEASWPY